LGKRSRKGLGDKANKVSLLLRSCPPLVLTSSSLSPTFHTLTPSPPAATYIVLGLTLTLLTSLPSTSTPPSPLSLTDLVATVPTHMLGLKGPSICSYAAGPGYVFMPRLILSFSEGGYERTSFSRCTAEIFLMLPRRASENLLLQSGWPYSPPIFMRGLGVLSSMSAVL
jgi:hypothetical protein